MTTTLRAPGSTRSSRSSSTTRTSIERPAGPRLVDQRRRLVRHVEVAPPTTPSSRTPSHTGPERTSTTARVKPRRAHEWRTNVASTSSGRMARSSSAPSSTSCSRWPRLLRSAAFVDRREQRRAHGEEQEGDRADDGDAVVEHVVAFDHAGVGGRVREQQQQRAPHARASDRCGTTRPASPPSRRGTRGRGAGCGSRRSPRRPAPPRGRRSARSTRRSATACDGAARRSTSMPATTTRYTSATATARRVSTPARAGTTNSATRLSNRMNCRTSSRSETGDPAACPVAVTGSGRRRARCVPRPACGHPGRPGGAPRGR